ncbi:MAG: hypothetical protein R2786_10565 [Flavobacteriaceae bacterium]
MYKFLFSLIIFVILTGCNKNNDDGINNNNPYLTPPIVNLTLNLNLPEYNPLRFPGNSIVLSQQGIKGIIVYNVNNDLYTAFDLTDPNHIPNSCSKMTVEGIIATCTCEDHNAYDIVTGQITPAEQNTYPMHQYRISRSGDNITVSN